MGFAHILAHKGMDDLEDLNIARGQNISAILHAQDFSPEKDSSYPTILEPDLSPHSTALKPYEDQVDGPTIQAGSRLAWEWGFQTAEPSQYPPPGWGQHHVLAVLRRGFGPPFFLPTF